MKQLIIILSSVLLIFSCNCSKQNQTTTSEVDNTQVPDTLRKQVILKDKIPSNVFDIEVYFFDVLALKNIVPSYRGDQHILVKCISQITIVKLYKVHLGHLHFQTRKK